MQYLYTEGPKQLLNSQADSLNQLQIEVDRQAFGWVAHILWVFLRENLTIQLYIFITCNCA